LIEERNLTAFRNILQEAVQTGGATEKSPEFLRMLQIINPITEDFHHFCGSFSTWRNGDFYNEIQRDDEQGVGIANLDTSQISSLCKAQKDLDQTVINHINGYDSQDTVETMSKSILLGPESKLQVRTGFFESYIDAALYITEVWQTNKLQSQAVIQPFEFLQRYRTIGYEKEDDQYFEYVGGAGGTGKSRVIDAIYDVFKIKNCEKELLITASSGSAGAKIQGVTIHSALGIGINDKKYPGTTAASMDNQMQQRSWITEKHLKNTELWGSRAMLIVDEISMISGALLNEIDGKCRRLGDKTRLFGGIPVVLFSGDFSQFPPVGGLSLIRIDNNPKAKVQNLQNIQSE
jgi:hypothetical protein